MLKLSKIKKSYQLGDQEQQVLRGIDIAFRDQEFVSILGASGSGKTTLLNIIGGLDQYDSGDLIIDGVSTKDYTDHDWDIYRNYRVGFIFQNYNLIAHQTALANVELALTLSGVNSQQKTELATAALKKVGLGDHIKKFPKQLSGGQMQRVAIARALVNNPDIILADEPTGALDSKTSIQIMDILKKISKDKLVIMVTHNPELAKDYSSRIIELRDGRIIKDSKPFKAKKIEPKNEQPHKSSMSLLTSLGLSFRNLLNKKARTILTAIAGSVGIIGIALVLSLSNGMKHYTAELQKTSSSEYPISIEKTKYNSFAELSSLLIEHSSAASNSIVSYDDIASQFGDQNSEKSVLTENDTAAFMQYIESHQSDFDKYAADIKYEYDSSPIFYAKTGDTYTKVESITSALSSGSDSSSVKLTAELPTSSEVLDEEYEIAAGRLPNGKDEVALVIRKDGSVADSVLYALGLKDRAELRTLIEQLDRGESPKVEETTIDYDKIIGKTYRVTTTIDNYKLENGLARNYGDDAKYQNNLIANSPEVTIVGILKTNRSDSGLLAYTAALTDYVIEHSENSEVAKKQLADKTHNILTGTAFDGIENTYESALKTLGIIVKSDPKTISLYPKDEVSKKSLIELINQYNNEQTDEKAKIKYTDEMEAMVSLINKVIDIVSYVIIGFVAISLVVSSIMIAIITYISVLERTKEIGILRAIGASKKDVARVFRAETIIEGLISGVLGVAVAFILSFGINFAVKLFAKIEDISSISLLNALFLIALSVALTVLAGIIPSRIASRKNPVEALRDE